MRIITIKRNCDFLKQVLQSSSEPIMNALNAEGQKFESLLKKIQAHCEVISLRRENPDTKVRSKIKKGIKISRMLRLKRLKN